MKNILCFGDSNTYGFNPKNGTRYDANTRWTGIIKKELDANIIEAGCNNRTAFSNNPLGDEFTGFKAIAKYIKKELDIVILSIGINDLQTIYNTNINDYEQGLENLIDIIKKYNNKTKIILCSPSIINENIFNNHFSTLFDEDSIKKSKALSKIYKKIAEKYSCIFIDLETIAKTSNIDGLHYDIDAHKNIAKEITSIAKKIF